MIVKPSVDELITTLKGPCFSDCWLIHDGLLLLLLFSPCKFFLLPFSAFSFSTILFLVLLPLLSSLSSAFQCLCCVFLVEN